MTSAAACVDMCRPSAISAMEPQSIPPMISAVIIVTQSITTAQLRRSFRSWWAPRNTCSCRHWSIEWACMAPSFSADKLVMHGAMRHARHDKPGVVLLAHARQLLEKADGCPQFVITVIAPGRHAGHLDTVLQDPEKLGGIVDRRRFSKVRRRRIKTSRNVALGDTGRAVADGAMRRVMLDADDELRRIVDSGRHGDAGRLRLDRADARHLIEPAGHAPVRRRRSDVVPAGINHNAGAKRGYEHGNKKRSDNGAHRRLPQNQVRMPKTKR